ncbi:MAG: hypothetical protein U9N55_02130, partial [candidate division Zixibacteria bacterium]|nr:hypothetical protein [candidate division Zixibacteria bacterium]
MKRNAFVFILGALLVFSFGLVNAQNSLDITGPPTGSWDGGTKVTTGTDITWTMHITFDENLLGHSVSWEIYIADSPTGLPLNPGPGFTAVTDNYLYDFVANGYAQFFPQYKSVDGIGADTVGSGGYSVNGIPAGTSVDWLELTTSLDNSLDGQDKYLCIDSAWYPPSNPYVLSLATSGETPPDWGGPYCYLIENPENMPAEFDVCPAVEQVFDHTVTATYDFDATDPDPAISPGPLTFSYVSGIGDIDPVTGVWSYAPSIADVGTVHDV